MSCDILILYTRHRATETAVPAGRKDLEQSQSIFLMTKENSIPQVLCCTLEPSVVEAEVRHARALNSVDSRRLSADIASHSLAAEDTSRGRLTLTATGTSSCLRVVCPQAPFQQQPGAGLFLAVVFLHSVSEKSACLTGAPDYARTDPHGLEQAWTRNRRGKAGGELCPRSNSCWHYLTRAATAS